ncbi:auxin-responsive protein SAUR71-like [Salvia hispanica]|uniref:auxin-responsive protein SAUR71-like n=1 Tax=Salvia hispanica TaxID=49212 RepID=UPI0020097B2B|nr:auxin-responsive protein SAUR71-like [Salvia hispanica]
MEGAKRKDMKRSVLKKLERYVWTGRSKAKAGRVAPMGCFTVYVGPEKQRFVIKTEYANHALFKMLLDDAELEYGYHSDGPLLLPCDVDLFCGIIAEIDGDEHVSAFVNGACSPFNPARRLGKATDMAKGCASYAALTPPRLHF